MDKHVIIKFKDRVYTDDIEFVKSKGGKVKKHLSLISAITADIPEKDIKKITKQISDDPYVEYIEEDIQHHILGFPSNKKKVQTQNIQSNVQSNIQSLVQTVPWGIDKIRAREVHSLGNKGKDIKVCIIDTGIDYNHEDLISNYKGGYNFINNTPDPFDDNGHGTHVAGTISAIDNNFGVIGVAPEVSIYSAKVLDAAGNGYVSDITEAITWAINNGMNIISMSLGSLGYSQSEYDACSIAENAGLTLIAAAGNEGGSDFNDTVLYPAKFDSVIAVAATDSNNNRASFSSTGSQVEFSAPGVNILSSTRNNGYEYWSGTSMACPHVAGAAALLLKKNPILQDYDIRYLLRTTAIDLGNVGKDWLYGYGLIDIKSAIDNTPTYTCQTPICNYTTSV